MKKKIKWISQGKFNDSDMMVYSFLPHSRARSIGPFLSFNYMPLEKQHRTSKIQRNNSHPHSGIAILTYILKGEIEPIDSRGNQTKVFSGGLQWTKAGKGIVQGEVINPDSKGNSQYTHALQFWINLPLRSKKKILNP